MIAIEFKRDVIFRALGSETLKELEATMTWSEQEQRDLKAVALRERREECRY